MSASFSPAFDAHIAKKYSIGSLEQKMANKTALQQELGWPSEPKRPILCIPTGMTDALGGELLKDVLPGILSMQVELLVLGKGSSTYGSLFTKLAKEQPHRVHIVNDADKDVRKMYAAADMALFLTDALTKEHAHALAYAVVPLSLPQPMLEDYDPVQERGNSFLYTSANPWSAFSALVRACETYKFPFDWRTIQRHCMETVKQQA